MISNIFETSIKQLIIYFVSCLIIIYIATVAKASNNFSYVYIASLILIVYIAYQQIIKKERTESKVNIRIDKINLLGLDKSSLITRDDNLIDILYDGKFIRQKSNKIYNDLLNYIETFLIIYESLKRNKNDIFLNPNDMVKPLKLTKVHKNILINDLRDQLERIMKHIGSFVHIMPHETNYLDGYYKFCQLLRSHLSRYYNRILSDNNFEDYTSQYLLNRSSENKYDFIW